MNMQFFKFRMPLLMVLGLMVLNLSAQKQQTKNADMKHKMESQREAYLTKRLELNDEESQKFMPVYNAYKAEIQKNREGQKFDSSKELSDKDAEAQLNQMLDRKAREIGIQKSYINKFKAVIPVNKIGIIYRSEKEYKEKVIKNIKKRRQQNLEEEKDK